MEPKEYHNYAEMSEFLLKRYPLKTLVVVASAVFVSLFEGISAGLLIPFLDVISGTGSINGASSSVVTKYLIKMLAVVGIPFVLSSVLLILFALIFLQQLSLFFHNYFSGKTQGLLVKYLRDNAFSNLMNMDLSYFNQRKIGTIVNTLNAEATKAGYAFNYLVMGGGIILTIAAYVALLVIVVSWELVVISILLLIILTYLMQRWVHKSQALGAAVTQSNDALNITTVENLGGIREIKAFGNEKLAASSFSKETQNAFDTLFHMLINGAKIQLVYQTLLLGVFFTIVYIAVTYFSFNVSVVVAFFFVLYRLSPKVGTLNNCRHEFLGNFPGFKSIVGLIQETSIPKIKSGKRTFEKLNDSIAFDNVYFSYGDENIFTGISTTFKKGHTTAIVGASGTGKSTLIDLLIRFYDPTDGRILVDDVDLREYDIASWRKAIAIVRQDAFLFNNTVRKNILFGNAEASESEMIKAAKLANAHEFITKLPLGYDTLIGDRGVRLSGGQRQRLALARAVIRNPQILILDEATSALDTESERLIQEALREIAQNRTTVVVAHRLSTIESADNIIVLEKGRIVEIGKHDALLKRGGTYAKFYRLQFNSEGKH